MRFDFLAIFLAITAFAVFAVFDNRRSWVRSASIWSLLIGIFSLLAIAFLFGLRLAVNRFERAGGNWSNELAAIVPFARELLDPFYLAMAVWVLLLGMLALKR